MVLLFIFAFLGGIFTVLSPCILPILPALLSASTEKGKLRPLGIVLGLIASFTFFTLTLTAIVHATGISANAFRWVAIVLIIFFGLVMVFPRLSNWFASLTSPVANLGARLQPKSTSRGFFSGFLFGIALGLIWTPCAGPILAAITTLAATQSIDTTIILLTLMYSIGAGLPMFFIAYGGNAIITSSRYLSSHAERIRQFFGMIMILTGVAIAMHWDMDLQQKIIQYLPPVLVENNAIVQNELEKLYGEDNKNTAGGNAPELVGIVNWINSPPLTMMQLQGKVVLIDFWTYSCINCLRTLPYLTKWDQEYRDKGLVIIGVHTPEFEFEKDPKNVVEAVGRLHIYYPVAQDNNYKTWRAFHNSYWPAHYLIDQKGNIVMTHFGEGKYVETENAIRGLLGMKPLEMKEPSKLLRSISPETYLGTARGQSYIAENKIEPGKITTYRFTKSLPEDSVGLKGPWLVEEERITAEGDDSILYYNFLASNVYLVLSGKSSVPVEVSLDDKFNNKFIVDADKKYDIVKTPYGRHVVSIKIPKGISAYAFTFGDE